MSELNGGIPVDVNPNIEIDAPIEAEPTITLQAEVETEPTIELQARVEMGGRSSEYNAEAWAVGERGGVPVSSTDQTYHNNSKYYAEQSAEAARAELNKKADVINITDDTQETVKTFDNGADQLPMALTVGIEPVQSGSGDPSPTNVRPISGWTGCNITRAGKNLIPDGTDTSKGFVSGYFLKSDGTTKSGTPNNISEYFRVKGGAIYTWNSDSQMNLGSICFYDENKTFISGVNGGNALPKVINVPANAVYARSTVFASTYLTQFEVGGTATEIVPYRNGNEYAISFPAGAGTVYGGTLTVNKDGTGTLVVDHGECNMGYLTWDSNTSYNYFTAAISDRKVASLDLKCSLYKTASATGQSNLNNGEISSTSNNNKIITRDNRYSYSDLQTYTEAMSGVQLVYELASPVEYTLTATEVGQILSLLGTNNLFCDTGDILSVDYSADTKMYVDAGDENKQEQIDLTRDMIANTEPDDSTKAYYAGGIIIHDGALYEATEAISVGETLIENQNIKKTSISDLFGSNYYNVILKQITIDGTSTYQSARIFKIGRMRMVNAMLSPAFFSTSMFMGDEPPTASELNFPVHYIHTENSQTVTEPCTLKYTESTSKWELIRSDGTTMTLGSNTGISATDKIHFYGIWFV